MAEEINQLLTISKYISNPIQHEKNRSSAKKRFDIPSREVLALTGTTYPMMPVRTLNSLRVDLNYLVIYLIFRRKNQIIKKKSNGFIIHLN